MSLQWFKVSYFAPGVLFDLLIGLTIFLFLLFKKEQNPPTRWLTWFFFGETSLFLAYFLSFVIFHEWGAFHRYISCLILFGNFSLVGFSYYYPKNDRPKEAKIVLSLVFLLTTFVYGHFVYQTLNMPKIYNFQSHIYTFDFGKEVGIAILGLFLIALINLIRKTIRYSEYKGYFSKWLAHPKTIFSIYYCQHTGARFFSSFIKLFAAKGNYARACQNFSLAIFLHILVAIANVFVKNGMISPGLYSKIFVLSTMIIIYYIALVYIDYSMEATSFMVKLVGISLGMILLILGYVANVTLDEKENDYDSKNKLHIAFLKNTLKQENPYFHDAIQYIIQRKNDNQKFSSAYSLIYKKNPELTLQKIYLGEIKTKKFLIHKKYDAIKRNYRQTPNDQIYKIAEKQIGSLTIPFLQRNYRNADGLFYVIYLFQLDSKIYEVGFDYHHYRNYIHKPGMKLLITMLASTFFVLLLFPFLFHKSIVNPLKTLLVGVKQVNKGNLNVDVAVNINDEIGYLSSSFNSMVESIRQAREQLHDYANTLEDRVEQRTHQVNEKMEQIQSLKIQQDGDYFLTSLLARPLINNANKSKLVKTNFFIRQKKQFEFRKKKGELGGDICVTGNLRLGQPDDFQRYVVAMNGDAMGKSMQGAGGSLVMGVVMNSIMARSAANNKILDITPEQWLSDTYEEIHSVFKSFEGTMLISATIIVIEENTGQSFYINAEHPFSILYRDGKASFIEEQLFLRKFGIDSEFEFTVKTYQFQPGDLLIIGSDGKDDIRLQDGEQTIINEDEKKFLAIVESAKGELDKIVDLILDTGELIDDLSLLRIEFDSPPEEPVDISINRPIAAEPISSSEDSLIKPKKAFKQGKQFIAQGNFQEALEVMLSSFQDNSNYHPLNRLLALIAFKQSDFSLCNQVLTSYFSENPPQEDLLYYQIISLKQLKLWQDALQANYTFIDTFGETNRALLNLADLLRLTEDFDTAIIQIEKVLARDPDNESANTLLAVCQNSQ